jgi:release factor glutamine methyltransferase
MDHPATFSEFRQFLVRRLGAFLDEREARSESMRWLSEGFQISASWLAAHGDDPVTEAQFSKAEAWMVRRESGEPWAHIIGWCEFRGRKFQVSKDVLIPRPETELVLEAALDVGRRIGVCHATDVGTGSGILAICMALETDWRIVASDISRPALRIARRNAEAHGAKIDFKEGSLLGPIPDPIGLLVSNPPYVDPADRPGLQRELAFEPESALFADDAGLALSTELLRQARVRHTPGVVLEIGASQGDELESRAKAMGWRHVAVHRDFAGHDRVLMALA